jgi:hypothetical protein
LLPNANFNVKLSFQERLRREDVPVVTLAGEKEPLIGPAWVRGQWTAAYDPNLELLPWTPRLTATLEAG